MALLPDQPARGHDQVLAAGGARASRPRRTARRRRRAARPRCDPPAPPPGAGAARARSVVGQEQVGRVEHTAAVRPGADVPVRVQERDRLPDGQHQLVAELLAVLARPASSTRSRGPGSARCPPLANASRGAGSGRRGRGKAHGRAGPRGSRSRSARASRVVEAERLGVEPVAARAEHGHVEAVRQVPPGPQVPGVGLVAADQQDARPRRRAHRRATSHTFRRTNGSHASGASSARAALAAASARTRSRCRASPTRSRPARR